MLLHIKEPLSILGVVSVIFEKDRYQKITSNLYYNHLILTIIRNIMNKNTEGLV